MMDEFRLQITNHAPIVPGQIRTEEQVYEEEKGGPGQDIYVKGAWILHTLRNLIGDDRFFEATRRLVHGTPRSQAGQFRVALRQHAGLHQDRQRRDRPRHAVVLRRPISTGAPLPDLVETRGEIR